MTVFNNIVAPNTMPNSNKVLTIADILTKKRLELTVGQENTLLQLDRQIKMLTNTIYKFYKSPKHRAQVDAFIATLKQSIISKEYAVPYSPDLEELFSVATEVGMLSLKDNQSYGFRLGSTPIYELNPAYSEYVNRYHAIFAVILELLVTADPIEELYFDVKLVDVNSRLMLNEEQGFKVDIMYRIGSSVYFVLILPNKNILVDYNRFNRKVLIPLNRLLSHVAVVIHPNFDDSQFYNIIQNTKSQNSQMPKVAYFDNLSTIIPR